MGTAYAFASSDNTTAAYIVYTEDAIRLDNIAGKVDSSQSDQIKKHPSEASDPIVKSLFIKKSNLLRNMSKEVFLCLMIYLIAYFISQKLSSLFEKCTFSTSDSFSFDSFNSSRILLIIWSII